MKQCKRVDLFRHFILFSEQWKKKMFMRKWLLQEQFLSSLLSRSQSPRWLKMIACWHRGWWETLMCKMRLGHWLKRSTQLIKKTCTARPHSFFPLFSDGRTEGEKNALTEAIALINQFWLDSCCTRLTFVLCARWRQKWGKSLPTRNCSKIINVVCTSREASVARAWMKTDHKRAMSQGCEGSQKMTRKERHKKWWSRAWL